MRFICETVRPLYLVGLFLATLPLWAVEFTVSNTNNSGAGSFRQGILDANANPGPDRIVFNIPAMGLQVIRVTNALPALTDPVEIDGYTQPGSSPNTLVNADNAILHIQLVGASTAFDGLMLFGGNSTIRGLVVSGFDRGILIQSSSNLIAGNFIGTDASGTVAASNIYGVFLKGTCGNIIGGTNSADRNVIAGVQSNPIRIGDLPGFIPVDNAILGNFVGVDVTGIKPLLGGVGSSAISVPASLNLVVGGPVTAARNVIAGAPSTWGVHLYSSATNTFIIGNYIGVGADGLTRTSGFIGVGGTGGSFTDTPRKALIKGNVIAYQQYVGIQLSGSAFDPQGGAMEITISQNSIFSNFGRGISFGSFGQTNDVGDADIGPNGLQNFPDLQSVSFNTDTTILGALQSRPTTVYTIEFFASTVPHSSGFGEGETYLGSTNVVTDATGTAFFEVILPGVIALQPYLTATATDPDGNTSMFSRAVHGRSSGAVMFHLHPKSTASLPYTNVTFVADATGASPLAFQWRKNGNSIPNATNATLTLSNVVWDTRGTFTLIASNAFGAVESQPAELTVIPQPTILVQPTNTAVFPGTNITFIVQAGGMLPIAYQWRRDGVDLPGANNSSLTLSNVDWPVRGEYTVVLSNAFGVTESAAAGLFVKIKPGIAQQPISQDVVAGGTVTLSVAISNSATVPLTYVWRSNALIVATEVSMRHVSFLTVTNLQSTAGYRVTASNYFGPPGALSSQATLTVLADTDHDGLPDSYEDAYQLERSNPDDARLDADGDGMSNRAEYLAGTDPRDPLNRLKVSRIEAAGGAVFLEFSAASNRTYTVQYTDLLGIGGWATLTNLPARTTNGVERITDALSSAHRHYRLATPKQ